MQFAVLNSAEEGALAVHVVLRGAAVPLAVHELDLVLRRAVQEPTLGGASHFSQTVFLLQPLLSVGVETRPLAVTITVEETSTHFRTSIRVEPIRRAVQVAIHQVQACHHLTIGVVGHHFERPGLHHDVFVLDAFVIIAHAIGDRAVQEICSA